MDARDVVVGLRLGGLHGVCLGDYAEDATARCQQTAVHALRAGDEDLHVVVHVRDAFDQAAGDRGARVALGCHHDADGGAVVPLDLDVGEPLVGAGIEDGEQVCAELREEDLRLRIAEARVDLEDARAALGDHDAGVEDACERPAHLGHR